MAAGDVLYVVDGAFGEGEVAQGSAGVLGVDGVGVGRPYGAAGAVGTSHAQSALQLFDLLGESGLGDARLFGGAGEVPVFGDGEQTAQMTQFQGGHEPRHRWGQ